MAGLTSRSMLLPEAELPDTAELIAEGRRLGRGITLPRTAFLDHHGVASEAEYKRRSMADGRIMRHSQVGYRDLDQTRRACADIHETLARSGERIDRFGMIFDQNMGYPPAMRAEMPKGTGLIVDDPETLLAIARDVPVSLHFGDYMIGLPASVENATVALSSGANVLGNLAQFYNYKLPYLDDDVTMARAAVTAIAMVAEQPREIGVSSNVDDGFGPLFTDLACSLGLVMVEQHIVEGLLGSRLVTVFGNMFANPFNRVVFQRAVGRISGNPGPMVYGSTTEYGTDHAANRATLANYLTFDVIAQQLAPSGHAVVPIPVTEYERIPDVSEIIDAQMFAGRIIEKASRLHPMVSLEAVDAAVDRLIAGGESFRDNMLRGFTDVGIDVGDPVELLLAIRRAGARRLEDWFGPGEVDGATTRGRRPLVMADGIEGVVALARTTLDGIAPALADDIRARGYTACVASTDVHEYGKILIEEILDGLDLDLVDGGVSVDPDVLVERAREGGADFIALGTYNGIALEYLQTLRSAMARANLDIPVFLGGRLNQVPDGSNTSLPVDVSGRLAAEGAVVCGSVDELLAHLATGCREPVAQQA